jgi:hypothetical protein
MAAGGKIVQAFPRVSVSVHDQQEGTRTDVSLPSEADTPRAEA